MSYIVVGLGNPGEEYMDTRHNTGRMAVAYFAASHKFDDFEFEKKLSALTSGGKLKKEKIKLVLPETFMNKSGLSVAPLVKSKKAAEKLIVVHDDLDLPLGKMKVSFNKSSGGHRGVENIIKHIKTEAFIRVRVGISAANAKGVVKKPQGEEAVGDFIVEKFKPKEFDVIKKELKHITEAIQMIILEGREKAMGEFNR
jgi:PTH1 family peptidyl-tRNA hydrolase